MKTFEIAPSPNIFETLAHSGYSIETAIADIVDNCFAVCAKNIDIQFIYNGKDSKVIIYDDGTGMTLDQLQNSLKIAHRSIADKRDDFDLGRFSLGLKSASASYCKKLIISSTVRNSIQR